MPKANVAIKNASTVCKDSEIKGYMEALQQQVTEDFAPVWGQDAELTFVGKNGTPDPDAWVIAVLDTSDQAGALGYHDLTPTGQPMGKVFAKSDKEYDSKVSVTISHELLELLGDPGVNLTTYREEAGQTVFYAFEACDPCEADKYGYDINGVTVSDFIYPAWFGGMPATKFDHQGQIPEAFAILEEGYRLVWTVGRGWWQDTGAKAHGAKHASRAPIGSRRERRQVGHERWARSAFKAAPAAGRGRRT